MGRFRFAVSNIEARREGIVESMTFADAVDTLGHHVSVRKGDFLEIGVPGFPPARFECVGSLTDGRPFWMPSSELAA